MTGMRPLWQLAIVAIVLVSIAVAFDAAVAFSGLAWLVVLVALTVALTLFDRERFYALRQAPRQGHR